MQSTTVLRKRVTLVIVICSASTDSKKDCLVLNLEILLLVEFIFPLIPVVKRVIISAFAVITLGGITDMGFVLLFLHTNLAQMIQTPTRCNNNGLLINPISSTCFGR